jgi:hypothetical protein
VCAKEFSTCQFFVHLVEAFSFFNVVAKEIQIYFLCLDVLIQEEHVCFGI